MLRLGRDGGASWIEGCFGSEGEARERARRRAEVDPSLAYAVLWEYRYGCIVGSRRLPLDDPDEIA